MKRRSREAAPTGIAGACSLLAVTILLVTLLVVALILEAGHLRPDEYRRLRGELERDLGFSYSMPYKNDKYDTHVFLMESVSPEGAMAAAGVQEGDIIDLEGRYRSDDRFLQAIDSARGGSMRLVVIRPDGTRDTVVLSVPVKHDDGTAAEDP